LELQAARCPSCSGEMQLNPKKETGFCMHCGSKILVKEAIQKIRIDSEHLIKNYLEIAMAAFERGDYSEAYDYYTKILEIDPAHSWEIHHYRGLSAGYLSDKNRLCLKDAVYGTEKALAMVVAETKDLNKLNKYRLQLTEDLYMFYNKIHELPAGTSATPQEWGAWCSLWNDNALVGLECIDYCLAVLDQTGLENDPKHDDLKV
jgi:DNA-directed RNA polymerase subunit RPC12/RpoP